MSVWYKKQIKHYESNESYFDYGKTEMESLHIDQEFRTFTELLKLRKTSKILEVGCGDGRFSKYLLKYGFQVTAVDLSKNILDKLRKGIKGTKYQKNIKLLEANSEKLPFPDNYFDAVICVHVLHHVEHIDKAIGEMTRVTRKKGIVGFIEPNPYCPYWYFFIPLCNKRMWKIEKGLTRCSESTLKGYLLSSGVKNIKVKKFGFLPSSIIGNRKNLARLELFLGKIPLLNIIAGTNLFKGVKTNEQKKSR